jgi:hypothetical protein
VFEWSQTPLTFPITLIHDKTTNFPIVWKIHFFGPWRQKNYTTKTGKNNLQTSQIVQGVGCVNVSMAEETAPSQQPCAVHRQRSRETASLQCSWHRSLTIDSLKIWRRQCKPTVLCDNYRGKLERASGIRSDDGRENFRNVTWFLKSVSFEVIA